MKRSHANEKNEENIQQNSGWIWMIELSYICFDIGWMCVCVCVVCQYMQFFQLFCSEWLIGCFYRTSNWNSNILCENCGKLNILKKTQIYCLEMVYTFILLSLFANGVAATLLLIQKWNKMGVRKKLFNWKFPFFQLVNWILMFVEIN